MAFSVNLVKKSDPQAEIWVLIFINSCLEGVHILVQNAYYINKSKFCQWIMGMNYKTILFNTNTVLYFYTFITERNEEFWYQHILIHSSNLLR